VVHAIKEQVDFILAVGGGSSIDTAKGIALGTANPEYDLWDIWTKKAAVDTTLPVGVVLTISAAGSEMSDSAVLTNEELGKKAGCGTPLNRPKFAIMNPELTYTLPKYQIASGIADIMMHTLERYFIPNQKNRLTDEIAEGVLRTVIEYGRIAVNDPTNYDAMSEIMWCGSLSHNDLTGLGRVKDFSVHKFGHALSAKYDVAHGASLTTIWGHWAKYVYENDLERFKHYAKAVWGIQTEDAKLAAEEAIERTVAYFKEIGMPTCISELGVGEVSDETLRELSNSVSVGDTLVLSHIRKLRMEDVYQIYRMANQ
jgi:alcohol dehydrogenase YqhD (iron-dependent ADH family)